MQQENKKRYIWVAVSGALLAFIYGWEVFSGNAKIQDWIVFIGSLGLLAFGLLFYFGIIKDAPEKSEKERYAISSGLCIGWGVCAFYDWMENDFAWDSHFIASLIVLAIFIAITLCQKRKLPK